MIKTLFIFAAALFLTGCSSIEFAVDWADTYLENEIDNYFDLDKPQSALLDKSLKEQILTTRRQHLPLFSQDLEAAANEIQKSEKISPEQVEKIFLRVQANFSQALASLEPKAQEFLAQIKNEQLKNFEKEFTKQTEKIKSKNSSDKKILENHIEQVEKQLRYWAGSLSRQQEKDIAEFCKASPYPLKERIENRQKVSTDFLTAFSAAEKRNAFLHTLLNDYPSLYLPVYAQKNAEYRKQFHRFIAEFISKMTPDEKKKLIENIKKRAVELQTISAKTPAPKNQ